MLALCTTVHRACCTITASREFTELCAQIEEDAAIQGIALASESLNVSKLAGYASTHGKLDGTLSARSADYSASMSGLVYVLDKLGESCVYLEAQLAQANDRIAELELLLAQAQDK